MAEVPGADGVPLHVEVDGRGPVTVVLSHGWTLDATTWAPVARLLDTRVVRYDHRGHGRSAAVDPASMTIDQLADDLAAVIAAVAPEGPLVLAGHSMGGRRGGSPRRCPRRSSPCSPVPATCCRWSARPGWPRG